jgi:hypothetical protein
MIFLYSPISCYCHSRAWYSHTRWGICTQGTS